MTKPGRLLRRLLIGSSLVLACSALALLGLYIANQWEVASPANVATRNGLVGIWVGDQGVVLSLHADGTATSQSTVKKRDALHFDWTVSGSELAIYQGARNHNIRWAINRHLIGRPSSRFEIRDLTSDRLELLDPQTGKTLQFDREGDTRPPKALTSGQGD